MTIIHRRAAARELEAARVLGTVRVHRRRFQRAPDALPVRLLSGDSIQVEVKSGRRRVPRIIAKALAQAEQYTPSAIPVAVLSDLGEGAIVALRLRHFAKLLGLSAAVDGEQLALGRPL